MAFQVVSLSALVPHACCEAHTHQTAGPAATAEATHCPMRAPDGQPCPMHGEVPNHHDHGTAPEESRPTPAGDDCGMRGSCDGPTVGFMALLSHAGVLTDAASVPADLGMRAAVVRTAEQVVNRLESPDSPPPRA